MNGDEQRQSLRKVQMADNHLHVSKLQKVDFS